MDKYFDGELLSGFEESPKTTQFVGLMNKEMDNLVNDYAKRRIADLEAKLAESEKALEYARYPVARILDDLDQLKQQLAEKEKELHIANQETLHFQNKYFAEKQIAIEELEKVKELIKEHYNNQFPDFSLGVTEQIHIGIIDQQINNLRSK